MNEKRGHWYLLTGLIIGAVIGLLLSITLVPVKYTDTAPYYLNTSEKDIYRGLIAQAYLVEADNARAKARLELLGDINAEDALIAQAQQLIAAGKSESQSRALALLAAAIQQNAVQITPLPKVLINPTAEPTLSEPTATENAAAPTAALTTPAPLITVTPRPTNTPQPTQGAPYELAQQEEICDPTQPGGLIQVFVFNRADKPVAGVRIEVSIAGGGVESFYTGLYPEISNGYADYAMAEGMTYNLRVGEAGQLVQNLSIPACEAEGGKQYPGSIKLTFQKPD
ncbi:MAG TPA: hypothetical protein PK883_03045 [Anaerolineaceae bacterium]|nr:hypothetical protein [Anaerolineaceae bacterium]